MDNMDRQINPFTSKGDIETIPIMPEGMMQTSVDLNNPEAEQMRKAFVTETLPEIAPVTGDVLAVKNYPEDISTAAELVTQGVDEGELSTLLGGVALGAVSTLGLLPSFTGVGVLGKIGTKTVKKATKNLVEEVGEDASTKIVDTVGEASQPIKTLNVEPPKKTVKAYKLFKTDKNGNLFPLFVKMGDNKPIELDKWTKAEAGALNEKTGKVKSSLGDLAYRPGFHAGDLPIATHIGGKSGDVKKPNYRPDNQVWAEVEMADDADWQSVAISRARKKKDGNIDVKTAHITDQIPEGGHYRYKTNPNMTGEWLIGGELKVNRILSNDEVKKINDAAGVADLPRLSELNMAEGGAVMQKQMEMFEDGGLMDEGGTIDPVSGNDVPPGSTQEEVRDDIPAQLSEGEFVFPADVVRYIGLGNLMRIRQEAKMGLKVMDEMGQMGNSEEATIPDDLPFDINDLDMEDEAEYNVGGFVPGTQQQQQYGISGMQQAAVPTTGVAAVPQQAASQQYVQPVQAAVPTMQAYQPQDIPTFQQTIGDDAFGTYDELRQYRNEAGNIINVPFRNGQAISPIPEGYTFVDPEAVVTEEVTTTPTTPQSTSVRQEGDGDDERRRQAEEDKYGPGGARLGFKDFADGKDLVYGLSFDDMKTGFLGLPSLPGTLAAAAGLATGNIPDTAEVTFKNGDDEFTVTGFEYKIIKEEVEKEGTDYTKFRKIRSEAIRRKEEKEKQVREKRAQEAINKAIKESDNTGETTGTDGAKANTFTKEGEKSIQDLLASLPQDNGNNSNEGGFTDTGPGGTGQDVGVDESTGFSTGYSDDGYNQGGLAAKPKSKKIKKMKQGGLASKK